MATIQQLNVVIAARLQGWDKELSGLESKLKKFQRNIEGIGRTLSTSVTLPIVAIGGAAIKMASDMEETRNKVAVVFKDSAKRVNDFAKTSIDSFGLASSTALDMAATFGDMATSMGLTTEQAADLSMNLVRLSGDLASLKNISIEQSQTALTGVFTGETESLKRLGISMLDSELRAYALSKGIQQNIKDMTSAQKINLRYAFILDHTTNSQGDFVRTQMGAANQMRIFQERLKELAIGFGELVLPAFTAFITKVNAIVQKFVMLDPELKKSIIKWGLFAAAIGPVLIAIGKLSSGLSATLTGVRFLLTPVGLTTAAFLALAGAILYVSQNWDTLKKSLKSVEGFKRTFQWSKFGGHSKEDRGLKTVGESIQSALGLDKLFDFKMPEQSTEITEFSDNMAKTIANALENGVGKVPEQIEKKADKIKKQFVTIYDKVLRVAERAFNAKPLASIGTLPLKGVDNPNVRLGELTSRRSGLQSKADSTTNLEEYQMLTDQIAALNQEISFLAERSLPSLGSSTLPIADQILTLEQVLTTLKDSLKSLALSAEASFSTLGKAALKAAQDFIRAKIYEGVFAYVSRTLQTFAITGPFALAAAAGAGVAASAMFNALLGKIKVPALAQGGLAFGPSFAMVGDNPNARHDPEVIAPLSKLHTMLSGSAAGITPEVRIRGRDLVILFERNQQTANRRGIKYA